MQHIEREKELDQWEYETHQISWVGKYSRYVSRFSCFQSSNSLRFETVLSFLRTNSFSGEPLDSDQVEFGVKLYEKGDKLMENEEYDAAFRIFIEIMRWFPGLALSYYKSGICLLELSVVSTEQTPQTLRNYQFVQAQYLFRCAGNFALFHCFL